MRRLGIQAVLPIAKLLQSVNAAAKNTVITARIQVELQLVKFVQNANIAVKNTVIMRTQVERHIA